MRNLKALAFILMLVCCLFFGQLGAAFAQTEQASANDTLSPARTEATPEEYAHAFDLALRVMQHKLLYSVVNEAFAENVESEIGAKGLTLSQMLYILISAQKHWGTIEEYLEKVPGDSAAAKRDETRERFKEMFDTFMADKTKVTRLKRYNDPKNPLLLETKGVSYGYSNVQLFVNHPSYEEPDNPKGKVIPADNLRQILIDFVGEAQSEIWYNVYDVDLKEFADALLNAKKRKVIVKGGLDKRNYDEKETVRAVVDRLKRAETKNFKTELVDSVGLNHQKIILRDPFGPKAAVLVLSANFTQSCMGPEGDAVNIPAKERPSYSVPNANHALLIEGQLPAVIARQEIVKIIDYGIRGQSEFPLGGNFQLKGPRDKATGKSTWITMTFSPNGGMGDISRDVLSTLFERITGPIEAGLFAFSSEDVRDSIVKHVTREAKRLKNKGKPATDLFRSVSDTPFTMRDWSALLSLSGMELNVKTGVYTEVKNAPLKRVLNAEEYTNWQNNIRVGPRVYGERHHKLKDGSSVKITAKLHHKVFILPAMNIAVVGNSVNPSAAAETNNEQIVVVKDSQITKRARGMLSYLWNASPGPVTVEAQRRNRNPRPQKPPTSEFEQRVSNFRERRLTVEPTTLPKTLTPLRALTCPMIFAP